MEKENTLEIKEINHNLEKYERISVNKTVAVELKREIICSWSFYMPDKEVYFLFF